MLTENVGKLWKSFQKLIVSCKELIRGLFLLVSWDYNPNRTCDLKKPVPNTDEMSCAINV